VSLSEEERTLARDIGFPEAVLLEARRHSAEPLTRLHGTDENFDSVPAEGVTIAVSDDEVHGALDALRTSLAPQGYFAFRYESNHGHGPDKLGILRTSDPFDALRTMKTNGVNYDIAPARVVERLRDWHRRYGLAIYGAGMDFVEATFVQQPPDMQAFAKEVYEFCPDVVDQGTGSVEVLADQMKRENTLYLWWD
jgi:hypothetical protein